MIPTMILFGLLFGRWWRVCLAAAAVLWPVLLLSTGTPVGAEGSLLWTILAAVFLGAANAAVGAGVHHGILALVRRLRQKVHARRRRRRRPAAGRPQHPGAAFVAP